MKAAQSLLDERLRALADPTRRAILRHVAARKRPAGEIAAQFDMARPTVSRHLRVLEEAKLLTVERRGTSRLYASDVAALQDLATWFAGFWDDGLPRLKELAEQEAKRP